MTFYGHAPLLFLAMVFLILSDVTYFTRRDVEATLWFVQRHSRKTEDWRSCGSFGMNFRHPFAAYLQMLLEELIDEHEVLGALRNRVTRAVILEQLVGRLSAVENGDEVIHLDAILSIIVGIIEKEAGGCLLLDGQRASLLRP